MSLGVLAEEILLALDQSTIGRLSTIGSTALSYQAHVFNVPEPVWTGQEAMAAVRQLEDDLSIEQRSDTVWEITEHGRRHAKAIHPDVIVVGKADMSADVLCKHCRSKIGNVRSVEIAWQSGEAAIRDEIERIAADHKAKCQSTPPANEK